MAVYDIVDPAAADGGIWKVVDASPVPLVVMVVVVAPIVNLTGAFAMPTPPAVSFAESVTVAPAVPETFWATMLVFALETVSVAVPELVL